MIIIAKTSVWECGSTLIFVWLQILVCLEVWVTVRNICVYTCICILYMLMFCYATCCVEAFILLTWCCVPAFAFEVDDQMLKCVVTGCWKMCLWLVAESCTYDWEVNHVPCLSQNGSRCFNFLGFFLGVGEGVLKQNLMGRGIYLFMCYWFPFHDLR